MTEMPGVETYPGVVYQGVIALEWPQPRPGYECVPMPGWKVGVFDALSGKQITTVTRIVLHASASDMVTADVTMYADEDGQPVYTGRPHLRDDDAIMGTFPFLVAEMRVRPATPDRTALEPRFIEPRAS